MSKSTENLNDEFRRIKVLCHGLPRRAEIEGLCDRALVRIKRNVPIVEQKRDEWKRKHEAVVNAECPQCGRSLSPDGDCYGCTVDRLQVEIAALRKHRAQFERDLTAQMDREYAETIATFRGAGRVWEERAKALAESIATLRNRAEDAEAVALALNARVEKLVEISL